MSNLFIFIGRLSGPVEITKHGDTTVGKFTLLRNEFAGLDKNDKRKERVVSIQFTVFGSRAEALAEYTAKGDQLVVQASLSNNNFERNGETVYGYNFVVDSFEFGAPGPETRKRLAEREAA